MSKLGAVDGWQWMHRPALTCVRANMHFTQTGWQQNKQWLTQAGSKDQNLIHKLTGRFYCSLCFILLPQQKFTKEVYLMNANAWGRDALVFYACSCSAPGTPPNAAEPRGWEEIPPEHVAGTAVTAKYVRIIFVYWVTPQCIVFHRTIKRTSDFTQIADPTCSHTFSVKFCSLLPFIWYRGKPVHWSL